MHNDAWLALRRLGWLYNRNPSMLGDSPPSSIASKFNVNLLKCFSYRKQMKSTPSPHSRPSLPHFQLGRILIQIQNSTELVNHAQNETIRF